MCICIYNIPKHRKRKRRRLRASATFDHLGRSDAKFPPIFVKCLCPPPCNCSYVPSACCCVCVHVCVRTRACVSLSLALALSFSVLVNMLSACVFRILFVVCLHVVHVRGAQIVACCTVDTQHVHIHAHT